MSKAWFVWFLGFLMTVGYVGGHAQLTEENFEVHYIPVIAVFWPVLVGTEIAKFVYEVEAVEEISE